MRLCTETMGGERGEEGRGGERGEEGRGRGEEREGREWEEGRGEEIISFTVMQLKRQKERRKEGERFSCSVPPQQASWRVTQTTSMVSLRLLPSLKPSSCESHDTLCVSCDVQCE